jgi:hypothetical protein
LENSGFFYGMWQQLTFGQYLRFAVDFVARNYTVIGLIIFVYAAIIFVGRYGGQKFIPDKFELFVMEKYGELMDKNPKMTNDKLVRLIYSDWKEEVSNLPSYIYVKSKRDYWIEKPSLEILEERYSINQEKATEILINNGVIANDGQ